MSWARLRWPVLALLYLASRLAGLTKLPMFLDERLHLTWASWIADGHRLRLPFISGRGLSVYLLAAVAPASEDPLLAGRLLTVAVGLVTLVASHRLALRATGEAAVADLTALLYVVCPFALFHDRMALTDSFLAAATALTLAASLRLAQSPDIRAGLATGIAIATGVASKTTGLVLFLVPFLAVALVGRRRAPAALPLAAACLTAALLAAYPVWLFFRRTEELTGALGVREDEASFTTNVASNLRLAMGWLSAYWTPPIAALAAAGLVLALVRRQHAGGALLLALVAVGPIAAFVAAAEIWYPRYLLFTTVPVLVLAASAAVGLLRLLRARLALGTGGAAAVAVAALAAVLLPSLRFDLALWTDPASAPFPALDRWQYVTGWPSGYGVAETVAHLRALAARHPDGVAVVSPSASAAAGTLRLPRPGPPVDVVYLDPRDPSAPAALAHMARARPTYVLVSPVQKGELPAAWSASVRRAFVSFKPDGAVSDQLYRVCGASGCGD